MNILVTGAKGMVGQALVANLKNIRDGKNRTRPALKIEEIYEYDIDSTEVDLDEYCRKEDFVFNLVGVNRPKDNAEFMQGNFGFGSKLLDTLKKYNNKAPAMLSSSIQAALIGRYGESDYGKSKLAVEELFFNYGEENGVKVAVYRFPNLMGHSRPNYNSAVSPFCNAVANDLPFTELLKTADHGQFSVNISKPGITKGQHWHNSKWEFFIVVSGHALIEERNIYTNEKVSFEVRDDKIEAIHMIPGWTHNIINLSDTENLVTLMWANEIFAPDHPDTFLSRYKL